MAESYISELGDKLSHGVANTDGRRVKIIAPKVYDDGNGNHPGIAPALSGKEDTSNKVTSVRAASSATDTAYPSEKAVRTELDAKSNRFDASYYRSNVEGGGWVKLAETGNFTSTTQRDKPYIWDVYLSRCTAESSVEQLCLNVRYNSAGSLPDVFFKRFYTVNRLSTHKFAVRVVGAPGDASGNVELWAYLEKFWGSIAIREAAGSDSATFFAPGKVFGKYYSYGNEGGSDKPVADLENHIQVVDSTNIKLDADSKVIATAKTDNVNYKILATASASPTSGAATEAVYDTDISLNPSTNTISANISGSADKVANNGVASADVARHIWFSDSATESRRVYDNNFTYNPATNLVTANISGNADTATSLAVTLLTSSDDLDDYKGDDAGETTLYRWISSSVPAHASTAGASAVMHVVNCYASGSTKFAKQLVFMAGNNKVYERAYFGADTGWTTWRTVVFSGDIVSTYSSTGTDPVNGKAIAAALGTLDVSSVGGAGKYISAISETDGKISATETTMDTTPTASSTKAVTSGGIYNALADKVQKIEFSQPAEYKSFVVIEDITQWYDPDGTASLSKQYQMIGQLAYWRTGGGYEKMEVAFVKFHLNYRWKLNNSDCCEICSTIPSGAFRPMIVRDARDANNVKYYFGLRVTIAWQSTVQFIGRTKDLSFTNLTWLPGENSTHTGNGTEFPEGITIEKDCDTLKWDIDGNAKTATTARNVSSNGSASNSTARHIWFSDSGTETLRVHDDNFKYTPSTNTVTANISGNADTATSLAVTRLTSSNDLNDYKGDIDGELTVYRWISTSVPVNAPVSGTSAVMHVVNCLIRDSEKYTKQIVFQAGSNFVYERAYLGDTTGWTAWQHIIFSGEITNTYSSTGTDPVNGKAIAAALGTLDYDEVGGDGKYISKIKETDGKISATETTMDTTPTASSTKAVTSGGVKTALDGKSNTGHTHNNIVTEGDNRNVATVPNDYSNKLVFKGLKAKAAIDNPSSDTYSYLVGLRGWDNSSGGNAHELAFNNTGIFARNGSTTTWGEWEKVLTSNDLSAEARTIPQDISKGVNLIVNGSGTMMSNYNFSTCEYLANTDLPTGVAGCFHKAGSTFFNNEKIAVNTSKAYYLESWYRVKTASTSTVRLSIACFDIDGKEIQANYICYGVGTLTKLTQDLNNGDTVVHLEDLSGAGWVNTTEAWQRGFIFWNYKNSLGYQYPPETYSRNVHATKYETANVNVSAGTITLNSAWGGGTIPAGTYVSRYSSGSTYYYVKTSAVSGALTTWTKLEGVAKGFNTPGSADGGPFRPGTAFIKVGWVNANTSGSEWIEFAGIELREIPEQAYRLTTARKLAVSLSNTTTDTTFNGSADVTNIKVSGTLGLGNGGTSGNTASAAEYNILSRARTDLSSSTLADNYRIPFLQTAPSTTNGIIAGYRTASAVWSYMKGKMSSDSAVNISGNAATATTATDYNTSSGTIKTALDGKMSKASAVAIADASIYNANEGDYWFKIADKTYSGSGSITGKFRISIDDSSHAVGNLIDVQLNAYASSGTWTFRGFDALAENNIDTTKFNMCMVLSIVNNVYHIELWVYVAKLYIGVSITQLSSHFSTSKDKSSNGAWTFYSSVRLPIDGQAAKPSSGTVVDADFKVIPKGNTSGILPIANGGTGKTTANDAANALLSGLPSWTADPTDSVKLIRRDTGGSSTFGQVTFLTVWNYIKSKISSVLGLSENNGVKTFTGNAATATDLATNSVLSVSKGGTGKSSVTSNSFLVGNGTSALVEKTPSEVLSLIGGQAALTEMTTTEVTEFVAALGEL